MARKTFVPIPQCIRTPGNTPRNIGAIITALSRAKLVKSARGAQGGYKLVKAPEEYTTGEILRAVEGSLAPVACLEPGHTVCARAKKCITLNLYKEIQGSRGFCRRSYDAGGPGGPAGGAG